MDKRFNLITILLSLVVTIVMVPFLPAIIPTIIFSIFQLVIIGCAFVQNVIVKYIIKISTFISKYFDKYINGPLWDILRLYMVIIGLDPDKNENLKDDYVFNQLDKNKPLGFVLYFVGVILIILSYTLVLSIIFNGFWFI